MRVLGKRVELAVAAVGVLVLAAFLGYLIFNGSSSAGHSGHNAKAMPKMEKVHGDGLSDSHDGYRLVTEELPTKIGKELPVAFQILNADGKPQTEYRVSKEKRLHMLVLRDDLHHFQHVHPELDGDTWRTTIEVPDGGQYRLFAEFVPESTAKKPHATLLGVPFTIPGDTKFEPLPEPVEEVKVDGYGVKRLGAAQPPVDKPVMLKFAITKDGKPAELGTYLGAYAHVSAFNAMTMATAHIHPKQQPGDPLPDDALTMHTQFDQRGEHRVFIEFRAGGKVHTAAFTLFAT